MKRVAFALGIFVFAAGNPAWGARGPLPNVSLVNQEGKPLQLYDMKGKYLLVSFIYSRCPTAKMCPLTVRLVNQTLKAWKKALPDKPVLALTITLDPKNDTPKALKNYGKNHNVDFSTTTFATGNEKTLDDFASEFNVIGIPDQGTISHNMKTVLVGPDLVPIRDFKENEWKPEDILEEAKKSPTGR